MQIGDHPINSVVVGDALEFLKSLPAASVPMFLFSPPYNLGVLNNGRGIGRNDRSRKWNGGELAQGYGMYDDAISPAEYITWQKEILLACWEALSHNGAIYYNHKPRVIEGILHTPLELNPDLPLRQIVIWARGSGFNFSPCYYMPTHEWIMIFAKPDFRLRDQAASGVGNTWYIPPEINTWHPAPFPLALAHRAIETVMPKFVVDPFSGSGTTAVAAKQLGVDFLCNELSEEYAEKSRKRIERTHYKPTLFEERSVQEQLVFA